MYNALPCDITSVFSSIILVLMKCEKMFNHRYNVMDRLHGVKGQGDNVTFGEKKHKVQCLGYMDRFAV